MKHSHCYKTLLIEKSSEKASLFEWKKYQLLLIRVDVLQMSDVQMPERPIARINGSFIQWFC
ncbi:tail fiber assembly protein [Photorhabdus caribbeanensis]|uniref:tail fiber assembly protein n=1 Tax=Photorhabdus caribbeanensis TaxID=1004165 RepID=UPI001FE4FA3F|nr:tail fiber assembly protein [Photorhabdus caribbeanensis]